ncbi:MAG: dienelactone hydrolase family protein [Rhodospirillales bacterium]|jgi:phospholipase/carboxylesterase|nr:dienelactone hydrolase family protein [Rhodospirillales bacterium]MDP6884306.1 dienelactone hydrolase family protein [Rhodospirillales bacterium]
MADLPTLDGPSFAPSSGGPPRHLIILLHGVGADGNDLIGLAPHFAQALPDAHFVSPNAPFAYDMAPFGRQWFSIRDFGPEARLAGALAAAPIVEAFIDAQLTHYGLDANRLALVGFSQGTMMALQVGLRRHPSIAGILGYSGLLVGEARLADEIASRPPVHLIHGADDELIPAPALPAAVSALEDLGVPVASHLCPGLGHGIDEEGLRLGCDFLVRVLAATTP